MFNNPMYYNNPYAFQNFGGSQIANKSLLSSLFSHRMNWSSILNNTQKTLNVINQAIPAYYQIKPIFSNAKTMLRMINALKDDEKEKASSTNNETNNIIEDNTKKDASGPIFFL